MSKYHTILVAGFGGQGVMLFGQILAYAGAEQNQNSLWFPSYGPETRGGTANCNVILSDGPIDSPIFSSADYVVVFNKPSYDKFASKVKKNGTIFYNSSLIYDIIEEGVKNIPVPCNEIADELGNSKVLNMVMLGAFLELSKMFTDEAIESQLQKMLGEDKQHLLDVNKKAISRGRQVIKQLGAGHAL